MSKYRVYEIAKDYNTTSKVIIDILARNSIVAKNHMTSIDEDAKVIIDRTFARKTGPAETTAGKINVKAENPVPAPNHSVQPKPDNTRGPGQQQSARPQYSQSQQRPFQSRPPYQGNSQQQPYSQQPRQGTNQQHNGQPQQQRPQGAQQQRPFQQNRQGYPNTPAHSQQPRSNSQFSQPNRPQGAQQQPFRSNQSQGANMQSSSERRPQQPQGNRPYTNQNARPGDQFQSRNQPGPGMRPAGGGSPQRPQQPGTGRFDNNRGPASAGTGQQNRTDNNRRPGGRPEPTNTRDKQQQQREQVYNKKHSGRQNQNRFQQNNVSTPVKPQEPVRPKVIKVGESITVKDLAAKLSRQVSDVIKKLMMLGVMVTINQEVDFDTATLLAEEFGVKVEQLPPEEDPTEIPEIEDEPASLQYRPPVVTIMGHVDHGKTSLLDSIRKTHVTEHEAGGITQHIGAYQVNHNGKKIVFLDTPGHEAFTAMRARGAQVTDVAILVVAADDGVMPQTIEAMNHAKSAKVPIIVAVNKMDKPNANPDRVKQQLSEHGLVPEDWGGDTIFVSVSAYKKTGISDLLEMILLVAEMQDLKANPDRLAAGTIIEAQLDKGRGPVATILIQKGTLHIGDSIIAGIAYGKVRAMVNDRGEKVKKAEPSTPVEVLGLSDVPLAGDIMVATDEKTMRAVAEKRATKKRTEELHQDSKVSLDDLFRQIQEGSIKDLNIVVKADVQGSIEALRQALQNLKNKEVRVNIIHAGVGAINESDVMLAATSNGLIIGFNVRPDANARKAADSEKVDIRMYRVIYEAINDVEAAMTGMLAPEYKEVIQGRAEVRQVISVPKTVVAGSYILEGKITNSSEVRLIRNGIVVHEGKIEALRRFKDDVKEVASGFECGISLEKFRDVKEGDIIEAFTMEIVKQSS